MISDTSVWATIQRHGPLRLLVATVLNVGLCWLFFAVLLAL